MQVDAAAPVHGAAIGVPLGCEETDALGRAHLFVLARMFRSDQ